MKSLFHLVLVVLSFNLFSNDFYPLKFPVDCNQGTLELRFTWVIEEGEEEQKRSWFISYSDIEKEVEGLNMPRAFESPKFGKSFEVLLDDGTRIFLDGVAVQTKMKENDIGEFVRLKDRGSLDAYLVSVKTGEYQVLLGNIQGAEFIKK